MPLPRFRIRSIMIGIAFLALLLTTLGQAVSLQRAAAREQRLMAEIEMQRAISEERTLQAINEVKRFHDAIANEPELKNSPALDGLRQRLLKE
jgi:hypothetical protein